MSQIFKKLKKNKKQNYPIFSDCYRKFLQFKLCKKLSTHLLSVKEVVNRMFYKVLKSVEERINRF